MIRKKKTSTAINTKAAKITIKEIRKEEDDRLAMWVRERERERVREPCRREEKVCVVLSVDHDFQNIYNNVIEQC